MRKFHRWISVLVGVFILFIAVTGVLSQVGVLVNNGGFEKEVEEKGAKQTAAIGAAIAPPASAHEEDEAIVEPKAFVCPADMTCRPKRTPKPGEWNVGYLHHLHSGEEFGPAGVIISIVSGLGLIFFAISGMWMYLQMFRARAKNGRKGLFW
ncbi:PepSY domain-containing protein [Sphingomonas jaspsi]|uniref:PepSY domain-containing protein n=1 Tax=Sphingomonas jaspsi TaxID=392409 RepID=UPI0004B84C04|nr:PepSY domain-containing protein [Sphingomonas jaspsi]